jgi:hypothetical protein
VALQWRPAFRYGSRQYDLTITWIAARLNSPLQLNHKNRQFN